MRLPRDRPPLIVALVLVVVTALPAGLARVPLAAADPASMPLAVSGPALTARPACPGVPAGVRATQVLLVRSAGTYASVSACVRRDGRWVRSLGPFDARVGRAGVSTVGAKREGDGQTPGGVFPLRGGFGYTGNPGLLLGWHRTTSADVWVDDPSSRLYNTRQRNPANGRWNSAERLRISAYRYAQVIGYNPGRIPGRGSAIFLHLGLARPTSGCVSMAQGPLLRILRWERPGAVIVIR